MRLSWLAANVETPMSHAHVGSSPCLSPSLPAPNLNVDVNAVDQPPRRDASWPVPGDEDDGITLRGLLAINWKRKVVSNGRSPVPFQSFDVVVAVAGQRAARFELGAPRGAGLSLSHRGRAAAAGAGK